MRPLPVRPDNLEGEGGGKGGGGKGGERGRSHTIDSPTVVPVR